MRAHLVFFSISITTCTNSRVANRHILQNTRRKVERPILSTVTIKVIVAVSCMDSSTEVSIDPGSHSYCKEEYELHITNMWATLTNMISSQNRTFINALKEIR